MARKKIELTDTTNYKPPSTFEEWVAINGEPEYLGETTPSYTKGIRVEDCTDTTEIIDTSDIIMEDKNGNPQINYKRFVDVFAKVLKHLIY